MRIKVIVFRTAYWLPGTDYVKVISSLVEGIVQDQDIITVSEKALSVARGSIVDESRITPSSVARFLSSFWMRRIWGGPLGQITRLKKRTIKRLRNYPSVEGAAHKQVALRKAGVLQALRHFSEGGIDASNLPYSYVSLPIKDAPQIADTIRLAIEKRYGIRIAAMIVDGDATFSFKNLHLAPRHVEVEGLVHFGGFLTFVFGRALHLKKRATPIAVSGGTFNPDYALTIAEIANRARGYGAGLTAWDMARRFKVRINEITWKMLESVPHKPVVIVRVSE